MIVLVCDDHGMYVDLDGRCVLDRLPFPVIVLANRRSIGQLAVSSPHVELRQVEWGKHDNVRAAARQIAAARSVLAVATLNESLIDLAAELREALSVVGMGCELAARFRDKLHMKRLLAAAAIRVPEHVCCSDRAQVQVLLARHRRLVIKPVDGFGSRSVSFIDSADQLDAWYREQSATAGYQAEEFIDGRMYHVNSVVRDGQVLVTLSAAYLPGMGDVDFRTGTPYASLVEGDCALRERLTRFAERVIATLGMQHGVTHLECFVTGAGDIVFCEVAARPGGGGIIQLIELSLGCNYAYLSLLLQGEQGGHAEIPRAIDDRTCGMIGFRLADNCTIEGIADPRAFSEPWLRFQRWYAKVGDFVPGARHGTDFVAMMVIDAPDPTTFHQRMQAVRARFDLALQVRTQQCITTEARGYA
jgi:biotin carboxylase